jgi:hypothetical protein
LRKPEQVSEAAGTLQKWLLGSEDEIEIGGEA